MSDVHVDFLDGGKDEAIISITQRSWFGFGQIRTRKYRGSCTVWRDMETGRRVSTPMEMRLSDHWQVAKWNRENLISWVIG